MNAGWFGLLAALFVLLPTVTLAAAVVIFDSGRTEPLAPYFEAFEGEGDAPQASPARPAVAAPFHISFPIHTPQLRVEQVVPRPLPATPLPLARAFFLLGTDAYSRQWLAVRRPELERLGAVGMVVEANSLDELLALRRIAGGLSLTPASATDLAAALGLDTYPVLITPQGIRP